MNARLAEAEERGITKGKIEIVKNFYKMGLPLEDIAKGTNLSIEEVNNISMMKVSRKIIVNVI